MVSCWKDLLIQLVLVIFVVMVFTCPCCDSATLYKDKGGRPFAQHYRQCAGRKEWYVRCGKKRKASDVAEVANCFASRAEGASPMYFNSEQVRRPSTHEVPTFMIPTFDDENTTKDYRRGQIESHFTIGDMQGSLNQKRPLVRETFVYGMDDEYSWERSEIEGIENQIPSTFGVDHDETDWSEDSSLNSIPLPFDTDNAAVPDNLRFNIELNGILQNHGCDLGVHDEIVDLINGYTSTGRLSEDSPPLFHRKKFLNIMEREYSTAGMKPKHINVQLEDGSSATVSLFDLEFMIRSLLTDEILMEDANIAEGYDVHTGMDIPDCTVNSSYGEIHTGDAWDPARLRFCGPDGKLMPISLVIFGDKSHTDLHGSLSVTPIIFTLSLFNHKARNKPEFWRPLAYIPNLSHGKSKADKNKSVMNLRNEHQCLAAAFSPVIELSQNAPIDIVVKGRRVHGVIWIHFFIGDIAGNNAWLCHYNGSGRVARPYRDCTCTYPHMSLDNPTCTYIKLKDIKLAQKKKKKVTKAKGELLYKSMSKHDVRSILNDPGLPLSDDVHGAYRMMPPELLHTSGSGLIVYMFKALRALFGDTTIGLCAIILLDVLHKRISYELSRQSEHDIPRGSIKNGILDCTKCQSHERTGNLFRLLLLAHTTSGKKALNVHAWGSSKKNRKKFIRFIKLYLAMEQWFHDFNPKEEVERARRKIAEVLKLMKEVFPRDEGQGYNIPKHHGMTKMQYYMMLFGSGINFFGGPGESHHKWFVKYPGGNTQRRVSEFAKQVANRMYETMIIGAGKDAMRKEDEKEFVAVDRRTDNEITEYQLHGRYFIEITSVKKGRCASRVEWVYSNKTKTAAPEKYSLRADLLEIIYDQIRKRKIPLPVTLQGFTELKYITTSGDTEFIYRASPFYKGSSWYDWGYVHYREKIGRRWENKHFPSLILGYINFPRDDGSGTESSFAAIRTSVKPVKWNKIQENFVQEFRLSRSFTTSHTIVPISAIVHPLIVISDHDGNPDKFFVVLPKRNWADYFSNLIN